MESAISDHLIVPFGVERWKIEDIKVVGVSTSKTYFKTDIPVIHIETQKKKPFCIGDYYLQGKQAGLSSKSVEQYAEMFFSHIKIFCDNRSNFECKFADIYWMHLKRRIFSVDLEYERRSPPADSSFWFFAAPMPIPQAHLYVSDPLRDKATFVPERMVKVDFAFWTGTNFIAIEIDGSSHVGSEKHIWKDRWLQRAGVQVIHILNDEIDQFGMKIVTSLLPKSISMFWHKITKEDQERVAPFELVIDFNDPF
jgi:hypothetical protein